MPALGSEVQKEERLRQLIALELEGLGFESWRRVAP